MKRTMKQGGKANNRLNVTLNKESIERFERMKGLMPHVDDKELIGLALKCLEKKTNMIIQIQALRKSRDRKSADGINRMVSDKLNSRSTTASISKGNK
ncbi:MAG: hypothetical protein U9N82_06590 [Thermodesulfobacteriota bacterium]|nr:hypothetical protein [Thermodesulfobacteriota bacterium]